MVGREERLLRVAVAVVAGAEARGHRLDLLWRREELVEFVDRVALRLLRLLHRLGVRHDAHHLLLRGDVEQLDRVVVALGHLLPVGAGDRGDRLGDVRVGDLEDLAVGVVELDREVARHLKVLLLVLAHRHEVALHDQDVRRHQDGIREEAVRGVEAVGHLVLVAVAALEEAHRREAGEVPRELLHLRHVALAVDDRLRGVKPAGEVVERHLARRRAELRTVPNRGHGVEIRDEHEHVLALRLKVEHGLHGAEVVAPVQLPRRLNACQDTHKLIPPEKRYHILPFFGRRFKPSVAQPANSQAGRRRASCRTRSRRQPRGDRRG